MNLKKCDNGHFYDAGCYPACPLCAGFGTHSRPNLPAAFQALGEVQLVGRGSTSEVYRISGQRQYALKMIPCGKDEGTYRRALYELEVMKHLAGVPQAVQLCGSEVTEDGGGRTVWLLEEYLRPFPDFLSCETLRVARALELAEDLCGALTALAQAGVAHLDVQPKNLFCTDDGGIKLGDFSSSLFLRDTAENKGMRGTLAFMAPETYREGVCGEQSDVYSAGLILYALFNRRQLPFADQGREVAIYKRLAGTPLPDMAFADGGLLPELMALVRDACAFDPAHRLSSATELGARLAPLCRRAVQSEAGYQILPLPQLETKTGDTVPQFGDTEQTAENETPPLPSPAEPDGSLTFDADSVACTMSQLDGEPDIAAGPGVEHSATVFCHVCGSVLRPGSCFCLSCGAAAFGAGAAPAPQPFVPAPMMSQASPAPVSQPFVPAPMMPQASPAAPKWFPPWRKSEKKRRPQVSPAAPEWSSPSAAAPTQVDLRQVEFSAVAPKSLVKGDYSMIDVVMYEEGFRSAVDKLIADADSPVQEAKSGFVKVADNAVVRICLMSPDLELEDNEEERVWQGGYLDFSFAVMLPEQYKKRQVLFTASVYINDLIATKLKFVAKCFSFREQKLEVSREDVFSAFISYASQDRNRVATIIQGMKKARPDMDIFFDVDSLRSGEDWEQALHREIERRDALFLCWSHNACKSKWVDTEWRYALECKGLDCIEPIPLDPPSLCPPPEELSKKHFNDKLLYIINSEAPGPS